MGKRTKKVIPSGGKPLLEVLGAPEPDPTPPDAAGAKPDALPGNPKDAPWHANREAVFAAMRNLDETAANNYRWARELQPPPGTLGVGGADFDPLLKAVVGEEYLRTLRKGLDPDAALACATKAGDECVSKWNTNGHKHRVAINKQSELKRWDGAGKACAEDIHRHFLRMIESSMPPILPDDDARNKPRTAATDNAEKHARPDPQQIIDELVYDHGNRLTDDLLAPHGLTKADVSNTILAKAEQRAAKRISAHLRDDRLKWERPVEEQTDVASWTVWWTACRRYRAVRSVSDFGAEDGVPDKRFTANKGRERVLSEHRSLRSAMEACERHHCEFCGIASVESNLEATVDTAGELARLGGVGVHRVIPKDAEQTILGTTYGKVATTAELGLPVSADAPEDEMNRVDMILAGLI